MSRILSDWINRRAPLVDFAIIATFAVFMIWSFFFMGELFRIVAQPGMPAFAYEILAAVTGSFITVVAMGTLMHFQSTGRRKNQYSEAVFLQKIRIYQDLLKEIFQADDDNILTKEEILRIEDKIGVACLVANERVVALLSQFAYQLKVYGVVYYRSLGLNAETGKRCPFEHFASAVSEARARIAQGEQTWLQCLPREEVYKDTSSPERCFVSLDQLVQAIRDDLQVVGGDISGRIERFMAIGYDPHQVIRDPNLVDPARHG